MEIERPVDGKNVVQRESNVELLRILAMLGVIVLHYNNIGETGGLDIVDKGSLNYYVLNFLEAIAISSVNLFILISGYFMCSSMKRSLTKPFELLVQVILFREAGFVLAYALEMASKGGSLFSIDLLKGLLVSLVPNNYFVILYVALFLLSVYINKVLVLLNEVKFKQMIIVLVLLFSVWVTVVDILTVLSKRPFIGLSTIGIDGSQGGYTIVNFVMMYCIGAYLRLIPKMYSLKKLILLYIVTVLLIDVWYMSDYLFNLEISGIALEYCNPLVVLSATLVFLIFRQIPMKTTKVINLVAKGSFTVFLGHSMLIPYIGVERYCNSNILLLLLHMVISCILIYAVCFVIYIVYNAVTSPILLWIEKRIKFPMIDLSEVNVDVKDIIY